MVLAHGLCMVFTQREGADILLTYLRTDCNLARHNAMGPIWLTSVFYFNGWPLKQRSLHTGLLALHRPPLIDLKLHNLLPSLFPNLFKMASSRWHQMLLWIAPLDWG